MTSIGDTVFLVVIGEHICTVVASRIKEIVVERVSGSVYFVDIHDRSLAQDDIYETEEAALEAARKFAKA